MLHFDREPAVRWLLLRSPHRLVVDLPESAFVLDSASLKPRGLVSGVRYGHLEAGRSRLILAGKGPFVVENLAVMANEEGEGHRLVLDIVAASEKEFEAALGARADITGSTATPKGDRLSASSEPVADKVFTIAIDPGHGGIDGGAESANGTIEKDITLMFSQELRQALEATGRFKVLMTRDSDTFLRLDDRVRIARQGDADLFISIHADTIGVRGVHGATVYTVSDKASDQEAAALAERENLADEVAGIVETDNRQVYDILADLARHETQIFSVKFAKSLVGQMKGTVDLIKNPHRSAGFRVLRAPDVPSVLVELGYLSNERDEERLRDPKWRGKAVDSIVSAVSGFAAVRVGAGQ